MAFDSETAREAAKKQRRGKSKATIAVKELLSPHADKVAAPFLKAAKAGEPWAVKLFFEYLYGKPKQQIDFNQIGDIDIKVTFSDGKAD